MTRVPVWDLPTRVFHWSLVVLVTVSYLSGGERGWLFVVHTASGYLIAALLMFRLVWGVIGSRRSRFADFIYGRNAVRRYAGELARLRPPRFVGHNPIGGWMIVAMLSILLLTLLSGAFSGHHGEAGGLFSGLIGKSAQKLTGEVRETLANAVLVLAIVHIAGVLADQVLTGESLIRPMIDGVKTLPPETAAAEPPLAGWWRTLLAIVPALLLAGYLFASTNFAALATAVGEDAEHGDDTADEH